MKPWRLLILAAMLLALAGAQNTREDAYRANNLGVAFLEQYRYAEAAASFRRALELLPDFHVAQLNLAIALFYEGSARDALTAARAAATRLPTHPQPQYVIGLAARSEGLVDDAVAAFENVLRMDGSDVGSRINLGQIHVQRRDYAAARASFEQALAGEPFNATAAYGLATALTRAGQADEAGRAMKRFEALRDAAYGITYSQGYLQQGRYGEALASTGAEPELVDPTPPKVEFVDATSDVLPPQTTAKPASPSSTSSSTGGSVILADLDADGDLDAFAAHSGGGQRLYVSASGKFADGTERAGVAASGGRSAHAAVAGDYDNDGKPDLLLLRQGGARLLHQQAGGTFADATEAAGIASTPDNASSAAFVDVDHDGDLDVFIAGRTNQLLRNNGKGAFVDVTREAGLAGGDGGAVAVAPTDFDNRRDIDLLVVRSSRATLFKNKRDGSFQDVAADVGLLQASSYSALAAADVDKDDYTDFLFARSDAPGALLLSDGKGRFRMGGGVDVPAGTRIAQFVDYDNDGLLDLLTASGRSIRLSRNLGGRWSDVTESAGLARVAAGLPADIQSIALGDIDRDGDLDGLALIAGGELRGWRNQGGNAHRAIRVGLVGRVSNRGGIGSKVEMRAGSLRQRVETMAVTPALGPPEAMFGLGIRKTADVVRVIWPSGTLQAETFDGGAIDVTELDRKPSSCPYLYVWNGSRFEFVTDFMGGGEIGYWMGPGVWNTPDPDEYVRIPPGALQPRGGRYEIRVTNELEEAVFLDHLQLVAVDHRDDEEVFPNEGLGAPGAGRFPPATVRGPRPPSAAIDDRGRDVLARLATLDREYVDGFKTIDIRGYAEPHNLTFDIGAGTTNVVLLATGWTDYAFSGDNVAAHQRGLTLEPPVLDVRSSSGAWRSLGTIGIPVGRPQTLVVDLTGKLQAGERELRIRTNMRIYWDRILVDRSGGGSATRITRLHPVTADLRWRGFSAEVAADGRQPLTYDYDRVTHISPWKTMVGRYTREGDVRDLLTRIDDMFVISRPGDDIALTFDTAALPRLRPDERRTFLLFADGFSKEMDISSATPHTVEPLPFHGMRGYPYGPDERYPRTAAHLEYQTRYNSRIVSKALPPLEIKQP